MVACERGVMRWRVMWSAREREGMVAKDGGVEGGEGEVVWVAGVGVAAGREEKLVVAMVCGVRERRGCMRGGPRAAQG